MSARIVLIHAVRVAVDPVREAFARLWPEARTSNLLDDALTVDLTGAGGVDAAITDRFRTLGRYAADSGADGILFTCSAFGPAIEAVQADHAMPVLKPNDAMFEQALDRGRHIGMITSAAFNIAPIRREFAALAAERGGAHRLEVVFAEGALDALAAGDGDRHDRLLAEAAAGLGEVDLIMLAQFSTARAREAVAGATGLPVLTSPDSAVGKLKRLLQ